MKDKNTLPKDSEVCIERRRCFKLSAIFGGLALTLFGSGCAGPRAGARRTGRRTARRVTRRRL